MGEGGIQWTGHLIARGVRACNEMPKRTAEADSWNWEVDHCATKRMWYHSERSRRFKALKDWYCSALADVSRLSKIDTVVLFLMEWFFLFNVWWQNYFPDRLNKDDVSNQSTVIEAHRTWIRRWLSFRRHWSCTIVSGAQQWRRRDAYSVHHRVSWSWIWPCSLKMFSYKEL